MLSTSSLDTNQKIYITESSRKELFEHILEQEKKGFDISYYFTAENLERYCIGKTYLSERAYSHIRALLKKEYKEFKLYYKCKDYINCTLDSDLHLDMLIKENIQSSMNDRNKLKSTQDILDELNDTINEINRHKPHLYACLEVYNEIIQDDFIKDKYIIHLVKEDALPLGVKAIVTPSTADTEKQMLENLKKSVILTRFEEI